MILDGLLTFTGTANGATGGVTSGPQTDTVAQAIGTYVTSNILDLGVAGLPTSASGAGARDIGVGDDPTLKLHIKSIAAITTALSGTLQLVLSGAPDNGSGAPGAYTTMWTSAAYTAAQAYAGADLANIDVPRVIPGQPLPRFLRLQFIVATGALTGGTIEANIVLDRFDQIESTANALSGYPPGVVIAN